MYRSTLDKARKYLRFYRQKHGEQIDNESSLLLHMLTKYSLLSMAKAVLQILLLTVLAPWIAAWFVAYNIITITWGKLFQRAKNNLKPKNILITSAASGLGRALALQYAGDGIFLALQDEKKSEKDLREVTKLCKEKGAQVSTGVLSTQDKYFGDWMVTMDEKNPLDLIISDIDQNQTNIGEPIFGGTVTAMSSLLQRVTNRSSGIQIAIISSLRSLLPNLSTNASGLSCDSIHQLKSEFTKNFNGCTHLSIILPGLLHVHKRQRRFTSTLTKFLSGIVEVGSKFAAASVKQQLSNDVPLITFPVTSNMLLTTIGILPHPAQDVLMFYLNKAMSVQHAHEKSPSQKLEQEDEAEDVQAALDRETHPRMQKSQESPTHPEQLSAHEQDQALNDTKDIRNEIAKLPTPPEVPERTRNPLFAREQELLSERSWAERALIAEMKDQVKKQNGIAPDDELLFIGTNTEKIVSNKQKPIFKDIGIQADKVETHHKKKKKAKRPHKEPQLQENDVDSKNETTSSQNIQMNGTSTATVPVKILSELEMIEKELLERMPLDQQAQVEADKLDIINMNGLPSNTRVTLFKTEETVVPKPKLAVSLKLTDEQEILADDDAATELVDNALLKEESLLAELDEYERNWIEQDKLRIRAKENLPPGARVILVELGTPVTPTA